MLREMKKQASDNEPFQFACEEIITELERINTDEIFMQNIIDAIIVDKDIAVILYDNMVKTFIDNLLGALAPPLAYIKAGKSLIDLVFKSDEIAEKNVTLLTYYIVGTYVYLSFIDAKYQYLNELTNDAAVFFNSMFKDFLAYESCATTYAKQKFSNSQLDSSYDSDISINESIYKAINRHYDLFFTFKNVYDQGRLPKGQCGESLYWDFYDSTGVLRLFGSGDMYDYEYCGVPWASYISEIKKIQFCEEITGIGNGAFSGCTNLSIINIPKNIERVGEYAFGGCNALTAINVSADNKNYASVDGVLYTKDLQTLVAFPGGLTLFLPLSGVRKIANYAFYNCSEMGSVAISNEETEIGRFAYAGCKSLKNIPISDSMKFIGENAFSDCTSVSSFTIPKDVAVINDNTFNGCSSLTSIQLPRNLSKIGNAAFSDCNQLKDVYFLGSNKEWNEIAVGVNNEPLNNAFIHFAIDDEEAPAYTKHEAVDATCTTSGNIKYYTDSNGKYFIYDDNRYTEITQAQTGVAATGHAYGEPNWNWNGTESAKATFFCEKSDDTQTVNAKITSEVTTQPTCEGEGVRTYTATVTFNGKTYVDTKTEVIAATGQIAILTGHTLSLTGNIGVNFYMELDDDVIANPDAYMHFTLPNGTTQDVNMGEAAIKTISGKTYYVFQCETAAKEMTDKITAQMFSGDKSGEVYRYTVKEYADYLFKNAYEEDGVTVKNQSYVDAYRLIESMVNYGAYSQIYFNHNTDALANADIENTDVSTVTADTINMPYDSSTENLPEGVTFAGASLVLESETVMNLYFTNTTGKALTFTTDDNVTLTQEQSGKYTKVTITDIAAQNLDKYVTVNVAVEDENTEYSVKYSPMNYCYNTLSRETTATRTEALKDVMRALYLYNSQAKAYFAAQNN